MKTLLIAFSLVCSALTLQDVEKTTATYDGFDDGTFFFIDGEGYTLEFEQIDEKLLKKYDLRSEEFNGRNFEVSYTTETDMDDEDEELSVSKIVGLKLLD